MKKLIILSALLLSCTAEDQDDCECIKETYKWNQQAITMPNGLPRMQATKEILSTQRVPCQEEQEQTPEGNGVYFDIDCY